MTLRNVRLPFEGLLSGFLALPLGVRVLLAVLFALLPFTAVRATQFHTVQPGDTLSSIAATYGVPMPELMALNGIEDPNLIISGTDLSIQGAPTVGATNYTIEPGDTLSGIAAKWGVRVRDLVEVNALSDPDHILAGTVLDIPGWSVEVPVYEVSADQAGDALRQAELEYGLPAGLMQALAWQESGWQQGIVSEAGAVGLTQVLPSTAEWALEWLAPEATGWFSDPYDNARMGAAVLRHWYNLADGDLEYALAAYYQGWHSVETQGTFLETDRYVANVLALIPRFQ